jgi:hypothetical protein
MDQGFQESLVHRGGGIGQPSDPPGNLYFDPILLRNDSESNTSGYCTDIFFEAAIDFISRHREGPFFAYIATNAPHTPLQVSDEYVELYLEKGLDEVTAKVYGMITNIDENFGKLLTRLDELGLEEETVVLFMTDNGHQQERFSAGLRGRKTSVYEGGIRVPFFVRWPDRIEPGRQVDRIAAHIDIFPTLLKVCGIPVPPGLQLDGISLLDLWQGDAKVWPDRHLFFQSHRGDVPDPERACAVRTQKYKLVQAAGWKEGPPPEDPHWELFDMEEDQAEQNDLAGQRPAVVGKLKRAYVDWFDDVSSRGFEPPRILLGTEFENPVTLTRQDWRGPLASWEPAGLGHWEVSVAREGDYGVTFRFPAMTEPGTAILKIGQVSIQTDLEISDSEVTFEHVSLPAGEARLEAILQPQGRDAVGVHYVDVKRLF